MNINWTFDGLVIYLNSPAETNDPSAEEFLMKTLSVAAAVLAVCLLSCAPNKEDVKKQQAEMKQKIETSINDVDKEIASLRHDLESASGDAAEALEEKIDRLEKARSDLDGKLKNVEEVTADKWESFKADAAEALEDARETIREM